MANETLRLLARALPDTWRLVPIGGTLMDLKGLLDQRTTKDVDVVLVALSAGKAAIPDYDDVLTLATTLSDRVRGRKDQTSVKLVVPTAHGQVTVEFVRGRSPGAGGYFISRSALEAAAALASDQGDYLELPIEALAFLEAWAGHDK